MYEGILHRMREMIRKRLFVMTLHAEEEMHADDLSIFDVEHCILTGHILEYQRDRMTVERKYRIRGSAIGTQEMEVVAKISPTGKLIIVTVYIA